MARIPHSVRAVAKVANRIHGLDAARCAALGDIVVVYAVADIITVIALRECRCGIENSQTHKSQTA
jgi:hypothetical protein